ESRGTRPRARWPACRRSGRGGRRAPAGGGSPRGLPAGHAGTDRAAPAFPWPIAGRGGSGPRRGTGGRLMTAEMVERVRQRLVADGTRVTPAVVAAAVRTEAGGVLGQADLLSALRTLEDEFVGAGALEPLLRDPDTTDVLVTGPTEVWADGGCGLRHTEVRFADEDAVRRLAQRLALAAGRRL